MKTIEASRFGGPDVLVLTDRPDPVPGPGEITIDVSHAAVGLIDLLFRRGQFKDVAGMAQPPFTPGLEVSGTVRALGAGVTGFRVGEWVLSLSDGSGTGGYASVYVAQAPMVVSIEGYDIDPALAVAMVPNMAMAHVALTRVAHLEKGESLLVHGALGGLSSGFPGMARQLGASRIVGTVRSSKIKAAETTHLPYDKIVDSPDFAAALQNETFDVVIDPVGGAVRSDSLKLMRAGSRLIVASNASGDWTHEVKSNDLWLGSMSMSGFNAAAYFATHPQVVRPALEAALTALAAGLGNIVVDLLPLEDAPAAHRKMESRTLDGRIVLEINR
ncbi:quinone oxidoreductase family protein [Rhizobium glycinendophyticum]|uniref:Zinc-binding dehydrogenase n=1 Tax=Rhizobium glycinendophyticum TaxID=2589807 RepID=A0A504UJ34_9HYPH|nr:zinc-binding dehydrogenase [Rhizobium glycinendophyticum]TPP05382.1 zinc-binding dehydrogenase [Rhizobium glycinendophyticum]